MLAVAVAIATMPHPPLDAPHARATSTRTAPVPAQALLPSLFPSVSPAKRERAASSAMHGGAGTRLQTSVAAGAPRSGLSPRKVDPNAGGGGWVGAAQVQAQRTIKGSPAVPGRVGDQKNKREPFNFNSVAKIGFAPSAKFVGCTSAASRLAGLHARPNIHPPADVFFTPPAAVHAAAASPKIVERVKREGGAGTPRPSRMGGTTGDRAQVGRSGAEPHGTSLKRQRVEEPASASKSPFEAGPSENPPAKRTKAIAPTPVIDNAHITPAQEAALYVAETKRARTAAAVQRKGKKDAPVDKGKEKESERVTEWKAKYTRAFPSFVFYFDADVPKAAVARAVERIKKLGGQHELFLNNRVTHHIMVRSPASTQKKPSPVKREVNVFRNATPAANGSELNVKVWTLDKLSDILWTLLGEPKPSPARAAPANQTLRTLLEDERIHGTRERDSSARRADHYYFSAGNCYLLVEDATGEHRPIMVKEYERPRLKDEAPGWPVLHETFLRPGKEALAVWGNVVDRRAEAWRTYVERGPKGPARPIKPLRSSAVAALNKQLANAAKKEALVPYQAASGNSVVLTSNIASTSNAHLSGGIAGGPNAFGGEGNAAAYAQGRDKRLVDMSKRVQVLKGNLMKNANGRKAVSQVPVVVSPVKKNRTTEDDEAGYRAPTALESARDLQEAEEEDAMNEEVEEDAGDIADYEIEDQSMAPRSQTTDMYLKVQQRVLQMLQQAKTECTWAMPLDVATVCDYAKRTHQRVTRNREHDPVPPKPGYCENCRVKYEDIEAHITSRRHTKFAQNAANFADLDRLLARIDRPLAHPADVEEYSEEEDGADAACHCQ